MKGRLGREVAPFSQLFARLPTELREKLTDLENSMKSLLNTVVKDLGLADSKTVKLDSNSQLGYFFRVTLKVHFSRF